MKTKTLIFYDHFSSLKFHWPSTTEPPSPFTLPWWQASSRVGWAAWRWRGCRSVSSQHSAPPLPVGGVKSGDAERRRQVRSHPPSRPRAGWRGSVPLHRCSGWPESYCGHCCMWGLTRCLWRKWACWGHLSWAGQPAPAAGCPYPPGNRKRVILASSSTDKWSDIRKKERSLWTQTSLVAASDRFLSVHRQFCIRRWLEPVRCWPRACIPPAGNREVRLLSSQQHLISCHEDMWLTRSH